MTAIKKFVEKEFVPVIFGNDINAYSMAREFYEEYGIRSVVFGKYDSGLCNDSRIIEYHGNRNLDKAEAFVKAVDMITMKYEGKKMILIGCADNYVEQIIRNRSSYRENVVVPYVDEALMDSLLTKEKFYEMCELHGLDYPKTHECEGVLPADFKLEFQFPVVLKPSDGVSYWEHRFEGQKKVYRIDDMDELKKVVGQVYGAGYSGRLIIQEFIPGEDSHLRIMVGFSGKNGKVQLMSLANVIFEEHSPIRVGNAAALVNEYNPEIAERLRRFLDNIGYIGFSTIDMKYDIRDGKYKVFEVNLRQGRSHYYVTDAGYNLARYLVEEFIYDRGASYKVVDSEGLWTAVPLRLLFKHMTDARQKVLVNRLVREKKITRPLFLKGDNKPERLLYLFKYQMAHYVSFRKHYHGGL